MGDDNTDRTPTVGLVALELHSTVSTVQEHRMSLVGGVACVVVDVGAGVEQMAAGDEWEGHEKSVEEVKQLATSQIADIAAEEALGQLQA